LRHCFATWVIQSGASVKDAMELARHPDPVLTLKTDAHTRLEELARVVDGLPTTGPWASDRLCDFAHILRSDCVSTGPNRTVGDQPELCPDATREAVSPV